MTIQEIEIIGKIIGRLIAILIPFYLGYKFFNWIYNKTKHKEAI